MNFEELKVFLESAEGKNDGVKTYLQGLFPATVESMTAFSDTLEGKSWLIRSRISIYRKAWKHGKPITLKH